MKEIRVKRNVFRWDNPLSYQGSSFGAKTNPGFGGGLSYYPVGGSGTSQNTTLPKQSYWSEGGGFDKLLGGLGKVATVGTSVWASVENINLQKKLAQSQINAGQTVQPIQAADQYIANDQQAGQQAQARQAALDEEEKKKADEAKQKKMLMYVGIGAGVLLVGGLVLFALNKGGANTNAEIPPTTTP